MKNEHLSPLLFFSLLSMPSLTYAETAMHEISLEGLLELPFIEIATGTAIPLEKAPAVATLITADDIKAMGAITLNDVLESVPGLHTSLSVLTSYEQVNIRGLKTSYTPQVLFMLNGYRISSDLANGSIPPSSRINIKNISKIEIIRGPGSAIYGADAFAGVINIITKNADELNGFEIGVKGGSIGTTNIWTQYGHKFSQDWKLAVNIEYAQQDADTSRVVSSDLQSLNDVAFGSSASLTPGYLDYRYESTSYNFHLNNKNWKIGLDGWLQRDLGQGAGVALALDSKSNADINQHLFSIEYNNKDLAKNWDFTGKFSHQYVKTRFNFNVFPANSVLAIGTDGNFPAISGFAGVSLFTDGYIGNPGVESTIPQLDLIALFNGFENHNLRLNVGAKQEKAEAFETKNFGPGVLDNITLGGPPPATVDGTLTNVTGTDNAFLSNEKRNISYISIQDIWEVDTDWTLTAGIRYDDYSDFGSTTNPRVALVWQTTSKITTKLLYGSAFRAPTFNELFARNNPVALGNANLKPETIDTTELALGFRPTNSINVNLNLYSYETEDMINFSPNIDGTLSSKNITNTEGQGLEIDFVWSINKQWKLLSNYANQSTKDKATNSQLAFVPKQQFYFDARWNFINNWELSSQLHWISDRKREAIDTRSKIDDYTLVNMALRGTQIVNNWEVSVSIKNVFEQDATEPSSFSAAYGAPTIADDFPLNERLYYLELAYRM